GYRCSPINLGANTDPYQPIERKLKITRSILEVLLETKHPCTIVSKNALVERDIDLLAPMAKENLVHVFISCAHLDNRLASKLEPRATAPHRRIQAIKTLNDAGVPCGVLVAPIIPALNDRHMEHVLEAAAQAGAKVAGYTTLRLPHELKQLFREWLGAYVPQRAEHVMSLVQQMNRGRDYDSDFHTRMHGQGVFAQLLSRRFGVACAKYDYTRRGGVRLNTSKFMPPRTVSPQGRLF
ncbi:MAG TPA: radical SAM protein, partial [Rhodanobacteraceae bacterium]|nr:radical SAM protein [Rhodanobacteraceae bacterium]